MINMKEFIYFGRISKTHGVIGHFVINASTFENAQEYILNLFTNKGGDDVFEEFSIELRGVLNDNNLIVKKSQCNTLEAAKALVGTKVFVPRNVLPPLEQGEFYPCDIVSFQVFDENANFAGTVIDVVDFGSGASIEVRNPKEKLEYYLIDVYTKIDFENETVSIILPKYV